MSSYARIVEHWPRGCQRLGKNEPELAADYADNTDQN